MKPKWIHLDRVSSTNSYLRELLGQENPPEWTMVIADFQEFGRGQGAHAWNSQKGRNLLMSVLLYPEFLSASRQFQLSIVTSLAVCDTLRELKTLPLIKWPNDILTAEGKIAGILIEHGIMGGQLSHSIIGIGVNVNQYRFPEFPVTATSLAKELSREFNIVKLSKQLSGKLAERYHQLKEGMESLLKEEYLSMLFALNEPVRFTSAEKEFTGIVRGINEFGELLVETEGTTRAYGMQTIAFSLNTGKS